jgi:hypothetical protein
LFPRFFTRWKEEAKEDIQRAMGLGGRGRPTYLCPHPSSHPFYSEVKDGRFFMRVKVAAETIATLTERRPWTEQFLFAECELVMSHAIDVLGPRAAGFEFTRFTIDEITGEYQAEFACLLPQPEGEQTDRSHLSSN